MATIAGPTNDYRVVQVHPLLRCNLRCQHCYSTSGPALRGSLDAGLLCRALDVLAAEGYNGIGISGGEPLLYRDLPLLLAHARSLGMVTTVTTNAMLVDERAAAMLREHADVVAVSVDGMPASHNRIRAHPHAFEQMRRGVARLREAGVAFGFIFTLTLYNLDELAWVTTFAAEEGARLLQVHPLEEVGRASGDLPGCAPDALELARGFIEVARLQSEYKATLAIQYDVADVAVLASHPDRGFAMTPFESAEAAAAAPLAALIAPIIVETDGAVVPLQYNFSRAFALGSMTAGDLRDQFDRWKRGGFPQFLALCRAVHERLMQPREYPFVNWYGEVLTASHSAVNL